MKKLKIMFTVIFVFISAVYLCGCGEKQEEEYAYLQGFEYHFYPQEYEEEYSGYSKSLSLKSDTDYKIVVQAQCESGSVTINMSRDNEDATIFTADSRSPCDKTVFVSTNTDETVIFSLLTDEDTRADIVVKIYIKERIVYPMKKRHELPCRFFLM